MESTNHEKTGSLPKALILSGSPHRNGAVAGALELVRERIAGYYDCELARAYELSVQPCLGCMGCRPDKLCVLPEDDGHRMGRALAGSELLVLGVPSYWSGMPAPLKSVFDRNVATLEYCLDKPPVPRMTGKKALLVISCASDAIHGELARQLPLLAENLEYLLSNSGYDMIAAIRIYDSWDFSKSRDRVREELSLIPADRLVPGGK